MIFVFIIILFQVSLNAEDDNQQNFRNELQKIEHNSSFFNNPKNKKQLLRSKNFWENRLFNNSNIPKIKDIKDLKSLYYDTLYYNRVWQEVGPFEKPTNSIAAISGNGRLNLIRFDKNKPERIWVGSAGGGIWLSENKGLSWELAEGTDFMSVGISDLIISYENSDIMFASTGDPAALPLFRGYSTGLLKSVDGGKNWYNVGNEYKLSDNIVISDLEQHPSKPEILFALTNQSIFKSVDYGENWSEINSGYWFRDIEIHPENHNIIYVSTMNHSDSTFIFKSDDEGASWNKIKKYDTVSRIELAVTKAAPNHIYALAAHRITGKMAEFIYSNTEGNNWKKMSPQIDTLDLVLGQGFYNLTLMIDPQDTNRITAGGVYFFRTNDFGNSWLELQRDNIHVDYHDFALSPHDSSMYIANDGGIYRMDNYYTIKNNSEPEFVNLSKGLGITQFYRLGLNKFNDSLFFIGSQDNGTFKYNYGDFIHANGADGMECFVGNDNQNIVYASDQIGNIYKSYDMGNKFSFLFEYQWQERKNWLRQFYVNPLKSNTIYAGYSNLWRNYGNKWEVLSELSTKIPVTAISMSAADTNFVVFAKQNTLYKTYDNGVSFISDFETIPAISYIYVDDNDINDYLLALSGYVDSLKVFHYYNNKYRNITYNLPNVPVNTIVKNEINNDIIVGTDIGVFILDKNKEEWKRLGLGIPDVIINELEFLYGKGELYAATFGRGLWKIDFYNCVTTKPRIISKEKFEICEDSVIALTFENKNPINKYQWSDGSYGDTLKTNISGEYYVTALSPEGCIEPSNMIRIKSYLKPEIQLLLLSGNPVCEGNAVKLEANIIKKDTTGEDSYTFLWSNGETGRNADFYNEGEYYLEVFSEKGCYCKSDSYKVIINPKPEKPKIIKSGQFLTVSDAKKINWYFNGNLLENENSNILEIKQVGEYYAEIINEYFCSINSDTVNVEIFDNSEFNFDIYPVPFDNELNFAIENEENQKIRLKIFDINGKIYYNKSYDDTNKYFYEKINTEKLAQGVYFISVYKNGKTKIKKIIKIKK